MKFTIDDRPALHGRKPPGLRRAEQSAAALPDGKMVSVHKLAELAHISQSSFSHFSSLFDPELCVMQGNKKFYGNAKTIKAYKAAYQL